MKNNKGFSLVELIIVIAIMAVLVGVLAPTYLQYVEKSKKSNDVSTVDSIINAIEICAIDPQVQVAGDWELTITIATSGTTYTGEGSKAGNTTMIDVLDDIVPDDATTKLKSSKWGSSLILKVKPIADGYGKVEITMDQSVAGNKAFQEYSNHAKIKFS